MVWLQGAGVLLVSTVIAVLAAPVQAQNTTICGEALRLAGSQPVMLDEPALKIDRNHVRIPSDWRNPLFTFDADVSVRCQFAKSYIMSSKVGAEINILADIYVVYRGRRKVAPIISFLIGRPSIERKFLTDIPINAKNVIASAGTSLVDGQAPPPVEKVHKYVRWFHSPSLAEGVKYSVLLCENSCKNHIKSAGYEYREASRYNLEAAAPDNVEDTEPRASDEILSGAMSNVIAQWETEVKALKEERESLAKSYQDLEFRSDIPESRVAELQANLDDAASDSLSRKASSEAEGGPMRTTQSDALSDRECLHRYRSECFSSTAEMFNWFVRRLRALERGIGNGVAVEKASEMVIDCGAPQEDGSDPTRVIEELQAEVERLRGELDEAREDRVSTPLALAQSMSAIRDSRIVKLEQENAALLKKVSNLQDEYTGLRSVVASHEADALDCRQNLKRVADERLEAHRDAARFAKELNAVIKELSR